ncbi:MAG: 3'(2'),5'-bisphosphate nucleotidase CysQ [Flexistipes sinusarabici]|uniref:3'(2'),5'-bisphosphate nucleotidase CysQ n=1 Tax=Flexistipes sinusarabici TaxID=2352 RepID=A0A5D0MMR0_FLESI|nr:3'(2'),5'-bisphosphate nucleotidase CysQ [Flexistipes sinusarabici]TYB33682.1 MAG: 3'(2'),5'-bisphosphate nucleotidase CysQ [Flexistipes sinusarabici]
MSDILWKDVINTAVEAGDKILEIYKEDFDVARKADDSPLTQADRSSHDYIIGKLKKITPHIPVFSEESDNINWDIRRGWEKYWLVDPLDGTKEFIRKNGEFTVNIALIKNYQPFFGVVVIPVQKIIYWAHKDYGSYKRNYGGKDKKLPLENEEIDLDNLRILGSRSHRSTTIEVFSSYFNDPKIVSAGSSLKFCLLAEGKADVYPRFGPTSEWDTAAGQCVLECAGGCVLDKTGLPLKYNMQDSVINSHFIALRKYDKRLFKYFKEFEI